VSDARKSIIIAVIVGGLAILVLVIGVAAPGGGRLGGWQKSLAGIGAPAPLDARTLRVASGRCTVTRTAIVVPAGCALRVVSFGGALTFGPAVKRITITAVSAAVTLKATVEGTTVFKNLEPGAKASLTFGTSGGSFEIGCTATIGTGCILEVGS